MKRKTSRIYKVSMTEYVEIKKEYSLKFGQNIYYVVPHPNDGRLLVKVSTFAEARAFVKMLANESI